MRTCIAFDDVLLVPVYSEGRSRLSVDTSTKIGSLNLKIPLISSPMDTVTESKMAIALGKAGGMGVIHRFMSPEEQWKEIVDTYIDFSHHTAPIVPAIGVTEDEKDRLKYLYKKSCEESVKIDMISIDIANGHSILMKEMIDFVRQETHGGIPIMAGNVATSEGYVYLAEIGVNAVRVGIGGGCFGASTKVLMADGTYRNINKVLPGECVINKNGNPVKVNALINSGFKKVLKVRTSNWAEPIYVTPDHKYLLSNSRINWVPIVESNKDTILLTPNNINFDKMESCFKDSMFFSTENNHNTGYYNSKILSIEEFPIEIETWDIEVNCDTHSFIANNSIVHNSICKTRIQTGFGVPTLASVWDCGDVHKKLYPDVSIIADGGIRYPADMIKSLVAGADAVICGSVFAGTQESPGAIIHDNNKIAWKTYRGTASEEIQEDKRGGLKPGTCAEGVSQLVEYKGSLNRVLVDFVGGLRSALTYANANNIKELRENSEFIRITGSGINESHAHGTRK